MEKVRLVGETKLRSDTRALHNRVSIEVDGDRSVATADAPGSSLTNAAIVSDSADVARFLRRWSANLHATARYHEMRERPPLSDPKPSMPIMEFHDSMMVACPACNGEGWYLCQVCDAEGVVTRGRADEWRNS